MVTVPIPLLWLLIFIACHPVGRELVVYNQTARVVPLPHHKYSATTSNKYDLACPRYR